MQRHSHTCAPQCQGKVWGDWTEEPRTWVVGMVTKMHLLMGETKPLPKLNILKS